MKILLNAIPFGYGPASKILSVTKLLIKEGYKCVFCGSGIAYEFFVRENICETIYLDLYSEDGFKKLYQISKNFDYALTCMEPLFVNSCCDTTKTGFIDSLTWMWDAEYFSRNEGIKNVTHYFAQNTFNAYERALNFGIKNVIKTEGIINLPSQSYHCKNKLLINFGGVENIYTDWGKLIYPFVMFNLLKQTTGLFLNFKEIIVTSSNRTCQYLHNNNKEENVKFNSLSHNEMINEIQESELIIATPGLTALIETYSLGKLTILLPPQNYSQYLILKGLQVDGYPFPLLNWSLIYDDFKIDDDIREEDAVNMINSFINGFFNNESKCSFFKQSLIEYLDKDKLKKIKLYQDEFIEKLGNNGAQNICNVITKYNVIEGVYGQG